MEKYCLNLSPKYAPNWDAWEVAREVISNAIDADPEGMKVTSDNPNQLSVHTNTVPDLSELFIIGEGTKAIGGETIGQFGEGLKLAALVVTRIEGGYIEIKTPEYGVTFGFERVFGTQVLHSFKEPCESEGFTISITYPGIGESYEDKILYNQPPGPVKTSSEKELRVFLKGIWAITFSEDSLWDWNCIHSHINRDRSAVSPYDVVQEIAQWIQECASEDQLMEILAHPESFECKKCVPHVYGLLAYKNLAGAFTKHYGEKAVLESTYDWANEAAVKRGYKPVKFEWDVETRLRSGGIKKADEVISGSDEYVALPIAPFKEKIHWLRKLNSIIVAPEFKVCVFQNSDEYNLGKAVTDDKTIWLSEKLFSDGNDQQLVATYLHEVGHLIGDGCNDGSLEFEMILDTIAARLALKVLK